MNSNEETNERSMIEFVKIRRLQTTVFYLAAKQKEKELLFYR